MTFKSLHICTSEAWGGLEIYASTLIAEIHKAGSDVVAVCRPNTKIEQFLQQNGVPIRYYPGNSKNKLRAIGAIRKLLKEFNFDVVHVHYHRDLAPASFALRGNSRCRLFFSLYMGGSNKKDWLHRIIYSRVDALFSSSQELNRKLPDLYPLPANKIHFFPYGRFVEQYQKNEKQRTAFRAQWGIPANEIVAGTMVRIDPQKGPLDFVKSFALLPDELRRNVTYLVVGSPSRIGTDASGEAIYAPEGEQYLAAMKQEIERHGLQEKIVLTGFQSDLIGYLNAMDIFVFPSHNEMYSLAVLDAMGMGLPVIATKAGGNLEQVRDNETGLFYPVADASELAQRIARYLQKPELRHRHGQAAREFVLKEHDMANTIRRYLNFCRESLQTRT